MATRDTFGVLLKPYDKVPVYHAPTTRLEQRFVDRPPSRYWYTTCGHSVGTTMPFLRIIHLDKFARPCSRCYGKTARDD